MKNYMVVRNSDTIIKSLTTQFGLPLISTSISVYSKNSHTVLEITMTNNQSYVRIYNTEKVKDDRLYKYFRSTEPLKIENRNLKYIFKTIHNLGVRDAIISRITKLEFRKDEETAMIERGTIFGDLVSGSNEKHIRGICGDETVETISSEEIEKLIRQRKIKKTPIFDKLGNINPIIQHHADIYGINLSLNDQTIKSALAYKSNDYRELNTPFEIATNRSIADTTPSTHRSGVFKPMSIVIPCYNSSSSIGKTLASIESQSLSKQEKRLVEVILVDDGSAERVADFIDPDTYSFDAKIIRLEQNLGLSNARNVGASLSSNSYLVFIDSDVLLSKNYLYEHNLRLQSLPDAVFLSLKQNVPATHSIADIEVISRGLSVPESYNDKRLFREQKRNTPWVNRITTDGVYEILSETNYFTSFGNGRVINGFDLPSAVIGHNMSMRTEVYKRTGGFPVSFTGWGLEDTLFGATAIAQGCFVIPVLACGVYHIDHPVRQVSSSAKQSQYLNNIKKYKQLLEKQL